MNLTLNNQFIFDNLGNEKVQRLITMGTIDNIFHYIVPWIAIISCLTNMLVCVLCGIIYTTTKKKNHKPAFVFIGVLSFFDMLVAISFLLIAIKYFLAQIWDCKIFGLFFHFGSLSSLNTLLALSVDRYIFIKKPLHYPMIMTGWKSFLLLIFALSIGVIKTICCSDVFELPPEDPDGKTCAGFHNYQLHSTSNWVVVLYLMTSPLVSMLAILMIYVAMFLIFRKLRKRLEKLKAQNIGCTKQEISFHQNIGICKKSFYPDIPGWNDTQIQTLEIRNMESGSKPMVGKKDLPEKAKRSGSMLKNLAVLASHLRAAKYILILVSTLLLTWTPFIVLGLYEGFIHHQEELFKPKNEVNMRLLLSCLETVIQNGECSMDVKTENLNKNQLIEILEIILHSKELGFLGNAVCSGPLFNSIANTILYAFWYPDFRRYLVQIPQWCRKQNYKHTDVKPKI